MGAGNGLQILVNTRQELYRLSPAFYFINVNVKTKQNKILVICCLCRPTNPNYRMLNIFLSYFNHIVPTQSLPRPWVILSMMQESLKQGAYFKNHTFSVISYMSITLPWKTLSTYIQCFLSYPVFSPLLVSSSVFLLSIGFHYNPWSSLNALYMYMDVGPSIGAWETYHGPTKPLKKMDSPVKQL